MVHIYGSYIFIEHTTPLKTRKVLSKHNSEHVTHLKTFQCFIFVFRIKFIPLNIVFKSSVTQPQSHPAASSFTTYLLPPPAPFTLCFSLLHSFQFLTYTRCTPASGPSHMLFPVPGTVFPLLGGLMLPHLSSLSLDVSLLQEAFPATLLL